jgi:Flp pilus assembly protein TadD
MMRKGKTDEAIASFQKILEQGEYAEVRNNLGRAMEQKGKLDRAITEWRRASELNPGNADAHNNLGTGLFSKGRLAEAILHWQKAIALNPDFAAAHFNLGNAFYSGGRVAEALAQWRAGLRTEPDHPPVLNKAARVLATCTEATLRGGPEAVALAERAVRLSGGQDPAVIDTLAAAYAEAGHFTEATRAAQQALALATQRGKHSLADALKIRIALYEAGSPLREGQSAVPMRRPRP